ncbi:MAG: NADPH-dependent F420 reductase [Cyclobacteriaceae bacterium]
MKIGVFGSGMVGQTMTEKLASLGHDVMVGTRDPKATLAKDQPDGMGRPGFKLWHQENPKVKVGTFAEAAAHGEMLVNATNGGGALVALESAGEQNLNDKVLLDISNPLDFSKGFPPFLTICNTDSLGEQIQKRFPKLKVVKSLNTMNALLMVNPGLLKEDHTVFMSGNEVDAKAKVRGLLESFGWKAANMIDVGNITTARGTEQLLPIWVRLYGALQSPMFNFKIVRG